MKRVAVRKAGAREPLAQRAGVADNFWQRARGLLGRPPLAEGEGLIIRPCKAIHTWGMGYPIDVAFLDRSGRVVASYERVEPNRRTGWHRGARSALELPAGSLSRASVVVGDLLEESSP
jgi:uncharacterized protein